MLVIVRQLNINCYHIIDTIFISMGVIVLMTVMKIDSYVINVYYVLCSGYNV